LKSIQKRVKICCSKRKKNAGTKKKTYLFRLYSSTLAKKVILKLRLFSKKKYWKECDDDVYWNKFSVSQVFQKDQKNKTKEK